MGGAAFGAHAIGSNAHDPEARHFFRNWAGLWMMYVMLFLCIVPSIFGNLVPFFVKRRQMKKEQGN
jgi:hypothetical protein